MRGFGQGRLRRAEFAAIVTVVVFVGAMALAGMLVGFDDVAARLAAISMPVLAGLLGLSLANYGLRLVRWHLFSRRVGVAVPLARSALVFFAGFAMTTTPGKVGEALRLWLIERLHGYRYARTVPIMVGDKIGDSAAVLILCLFRRLRRLCGGDDDRRRSGVTAVAAARQPAGADRIDRRRL